jgi:hypothetical protein
MLTTVIFIVCICCSCCCKCCRQIGFWGWDKWTPKECLRQTRERCCTVNNYTADRISYTGIPSTPFQAESLDTPPGTPTSARSLTISLITPDLSKLVKPDKIRKRPYKLVEDLQMTKERKGER